MGCVSGLDGLVKSHMAFATVYQSHMESQCECNTYNNTNNIPQLALGTLIKDLRHQRRQLQRQGSLTLPFTLLPQP